MRESGVDAGSLVEVLYIFESIIQCTISSQKWHLLTSVSISKSGTTSVFLPCGCYGNRLILLVSCMSQHSIGNSVGFIPVGLSP